MRALSKVSFPGPGLASPAGPVGSKLSAAGGAELCGLSSSESRAPAALQGRGMGGRPAQSPSHPAEKPPTHGHGSRSLLRTPPAGPEGHGHSCPAREARRAVRLPGGEVRGGPRRGTPLQCRFEPHRPDGERPSAE